MPALKSEEIEQYHKQGYVVPDFRLSSDRLEQLKGALERVIAANPDDNLVVLWVVVVKRHIGFGNYGVG